MPREKIRRDFVRLSERRREAMTLLEEGVSQAEVAEYFSVSRQTVSRWARLKDECPDGDAWRSRRPGRPGDLTDGQKAAIVKMLADRYVRDYGTDRAVRWTLARVAEMIEAEFGVFYSLVQVRNILINRIGVSEPRFLAFNGFWTKVIRRAYPEFGGSPRVPKLGKPRPNRDIFSRLEASDPFAILMRRLR